MIDKLTIKKAQLNYFHKEVFPYFNNWPVIQNYMMSSMCKDVAFSDHLFFSILIRRV